ncbi:MAG: putative lipid II flippase FtsW [Ruminiclostridium sp.]|nr:putative lipid II flippase FtsW [Ruminiclostridium sp.]
MESSQSMTRRTGRIQRQSLTSARPMRMYNGNAGTAQAPAAQRRTATRIPKEAAVPKNKKRVIDFSIPQKFDFSFFLIVLILLTFGLVMLFSASYASAKFTYGDSFYFIKRQLLFALGGLAAMIVISFIDYHILFTKLVMKSAIVISAGLMILVRVMGSTVNGAERWIQVGPVTVQPSEILKFVTIMVIAEYMQRNYDKMKSFTKGFFPIVLRIGIACLLVVMQPHLSATLIILFISICMLFIGGARITHVALLVGLIAAGAVMVFTVFPMMGFDYVSDRLLSFKDPEADIQHATYQTYQSLIALGSGGWFGQGLGNSHQKYSYLPFAENDFIFSVIVEELGFVGAVVVVLLFLILIVRGFYIAASAPDKEGMLLCAGIVIQIGFQAFLNIAVASNAFFNTGVSLPFLSYGGTALLMQMGEMGVVLNISRKASI